MIILGTFMSVAAIGAMCWLLFTLAVFALPFAARLGTGLWAYDVGAGWFGSLLVGGFAAGLTLAVGQALLALVPAVWARLLIAAAFVAPAAIAGYHATLGIVRLTMPSETWQVVFAVVGAVAVGITAFTRVVGMAAPGPSDGILARS